MRRVLCGMAIAFLLTGCEYVGYIFDSYENAQILGVECPKEAQSGSPIHLIAWVYQPGGNYERHSVVLSNTFKIEKENQRLILTGKNRRAAPAIPGLAYPAQYDYSSIQKVSIPLTLSPGTYSVSIPREYYFSTESPVVSVSTITGEGFFFQNEPPFSGKIDLEKQLLKFSLATPSIGWWSPPHNSTNMFSSLVFFINEASGSFEFPISVSPHSDIETLVVN